MESWLGRPFNSFLPIVRTLPFAHHMLQQWGKSAQQWRRHYIGEQRRTLLPARHGVTGSRLDDMQQLIPPHGDRRTSQVKPSQLAKGNTAANLAVSLGWQRQWRSTVVASCTSAQLAQHLMFISSHLCMYDMCFSPETKKNPRETAKLQLNGVVSIRSTIYPPFKTKHLLLLFKVLKGNHYTLQYRYCANATILERSTVDSGGGVRERRWRWGHGSRRRSWQGCERTDDLNSIVHWIWVSNGETELLGLMVC